MVLVICEEFFFYKKSCGRRCLSEFLNYNCEVYVIGERLRLLF